MGRLIDADVLKVRLYHNKKTVINDALVKCIDETPTAYDVEAKVVELEKLRTKKVETIGGYCQSTISKAISIVRGKE